MKENCIREKNCKSLQNNTVTVSPGCNWFTVSFFPAAKLNTPDLNLTGSSIILLPNITICDDTLFDERSIRLSYWLCWCSLTLYSNINQQGRANHNSETNCMQVPTKCFHIWLIYSSLSSFLVWTRLTISNLLSTECNTQHSTYQLEGRSLSGTSLWFLSVLII